MKPTFPALPSLPPEEKHVEGKPSLLRDELLWLIGIAIKSHPRGLQVEVGPSEIGTPCNRKLGHKLNNTEALRHNVSWRPIIGVAVHQWLAERFTEANEGLTFARYLVETRLDCGEINKVPLIGSSDLFDRVTQTVVDWKVVGKTTLDEARRHGPSEQYRTQAHLYGRGFTRRGLDVSRVAIMYLPNSDELTASVYWSEPYSETIAVAALDRATAIAYAMQVAGAAEVLPHLPTADDYCSRCPWFFPGATDLRRSCPGDSSYRAGTDLALSLVSDGPLTKGRSPA